MIFPHLRSGLFFIRIRLTAQNILEADGEFDTVLYSRGTDVGLDRMAQVNIPHHRLIATRHVIISGKTLNSGIRRPYVDSSSGFQSTLTPSFGSYGAFTKTAFQGTSPLLTT